MILRLAGRLVVALGFALLVAFAPSTAWADSGFTLGLPPSADQIAMPASVQAPASAAALSYIGSVADPVNVALPLDFAAAVLLGLGLCVFLLGALLITTWGN